MSNDYSDRRVRITVEVGGKKYSSAGYYVPDLQSARAAGDLVERTLARHWDVDGVMPTADIIATVEPTA
jgi:hypothetical protein